MFRIYEGGRNPSSELDEDRGIVIKWIVAGILFFLVVIELVFFAPTYEDRDYKNNEALPAVQTDVEDNEQVLSKGYLVESSGEKKQWELWSEVAKKKRGVDEWLLNQVKVKFYGKGKVFYIAEGKKGFVANGQQTLTIEGDVVITSSNGYVLKTAVIDYMPETRTINGPEHVNVKGPDAEGDEGPLFMEGDRFEADLNTNLMKLIDNVKGRKKMSHKRNMKISSREATFSGQNNMARFEKDVIIDVNSMRITGPRAKFLYADQQLHSLFIEGGVRITDIGKWGTAGQAEVFFKEDKYVFRGGPPKVVQGEDELIGDIITIFDGGERVQVTKAKAKYKTKEKSESAL